MIIMIGIVMSSFTWPLGMYAFHVWHWNIYLLEILIAFTESVIIRYYWNTSWQKALAAGFAMNVVSFFLGQLLNTILPLQSF
jgi:hypothetical protein